MEKMAHQMRDQQQTKIIFAEDLKNLISEGKNDEVKSIIKDWQSLDITDDSGTTLLHLAAMKGNKDLVKFLIDSGCDINVKNCSGRTPLITSILYNQYDVVQFLVKANAKINIINENGKSAIDLTLNEKRKTPVHVVKCFYESLKRNGASSSQIGQQFLKANCSLALVIRMNDAEMTRMILENREKILESESCNAIGTAMGIYSIENVRVLLHYGPGVDDRRTSFWHILNDASKININTPRNVRTLEFAKSLIERLISWNMIDEKAIRFLVIMFQCAAKKTVLMLLEQKLDVYVKETFGKDLLFQLYGNPQSGIIELIRSIKIDLNVDGDFKRLFLAARNNAIEVVQYLLDEGVDPNVKNTLGQTVMFVSSGNDNESLELLLLYGADIQGVDNHGKTIFDSYATSVYNKIPFKHLVLLEARGMPINQQIRDAIYVREVSKNLYHTFRLQIDEMKEKKIFGSLTLFFIVSERPEAIANCIRDESVLRSILNCCEYEWCNLEYVSKIKLHVRRALKIINLRKKAAMAVYRCTDHLFTPDHLILDIIVSFLSYSDLRVFV